MAIACVQVVPLGKVASTGDGFCARKGALQFLPVMEDTARWEQAMIARVVAGDDSALASIYDRYSSLVYGIAVRLVGCDSAADVTQEVFVGLWQRPERFDARKGSLKTFLAVLARRRAIDLLRRSDRRRANEQRMAAREPTIANELEPVAISELEAQQLRSVVESLPPEQRKAIELAYFQGLTFQQVATATGSAEGTAKSRLRLGLSRLAVALEREMVLEWT